MKILILILVLFVTSCDLFESEYEILIKDVRALKSKEKKQGGPNPVFDGVIEPDFPDEEENNRTFEGIDSNKDGIRDDIEIWINRYSENREVRVATKHFYKFKTSYFKDGKFVLTAKDHALYTRKVGASLHCLRLSFGELHKKYLREKHRTMERDRYYEIENLIYNTNIRKNIRTDLDNLPTEGYVLISREDSLKYCSPDNNREFLLQSEKI